MPEPSRMPGIAPGIALGIAPGMAGGMPGIPGVDMPIICWSLENLSPRRAQGGPRPEKTCHHCSDLCVSLLIYLTVYLFLYQSIHKQQFGYMPGPTYDAQVYL